QPRPASRQPIVDRAMRGSGRGRSRACGEGVGVVDASRMRAMDSLSQLLLGASVAAAVVPAGHRLAAMLVGAALGTLPDLFSCPIALFTVDPVARTTLHRGFGHSLFVRPLVAWAICAFFRHRGGPAPQAARGWFWAI